MHLRAVIIIIIIGVEASSSTKISKFLLVFALLSRVSESKFNVEATDCTTW